MQIPFCIVNASCNLTPYIASFLSVLDDTGLIELISVNFVRFILLCLISVSSKNVLLSWQHNKKMCCDALLFQLRQLENHRRYVNKSIHTLNIDCQHTLTTMLMKFWLYTEHIFPDVLNENDRKCDSYYMSYNLLSKSFRKGGRNSKNGYHSSYNFGSEYSKRSVQCITITSLV